MPQVLIFPLLILVILIVLFIVFWPAPALIPIGLFLIVLLIFILSFFRDPARNINIEEKILLSPADGTITDIDEIDNNALGIKAQRIGIFLSIFNVHINRFPCSVRVEKINYVKGQFINAASPDASSINESNDILMVRQSEPKEKLLLRQITGVIARRIVCEAREDEEYKQGEAFGMMKFGSRTELYLPLGANLEVLVKIGDKVKAGLSPLVRYNGRLS